MLNKKIKVVFNKRIRFNSEIHGPNIKKRKTALVTEEELQTLLACEGAIEVVDPADMPTPFGDASDVTSLKKDLGTANDKITELTTKLGTEKDIAEKHQKVTQRHITKSGEFITEVKSVRELTSQVIDVALNVKGLSAADKKKFEKFAKEFAAIPVTELDAE